MYVEFFGVPRERAGVSGLEVQADTLGQLLGALAARIPSFDQFVSEQAIGANRLHPAFLASLNGERFVSDPETALGKDDCVLILSADAGG
jgi:molybdopterin converting factor small subunit